MANYSKRTKDKLKEAVKQYETDNKAINKGTARPNGSAQPSKDV